MDDSVQGGHPVTHSTRCTSLSFTCDKHPRITILGNCLGRFSNTRGCEKYPKIPFWEGVADAQMLE